MTCDRKENGRKRHSDPGRKGERESGDPGREERRDNDSSQEGVIESSDPGYDTHGRGKLPMREEGDGCCA